MARRITEAADYLDVPHRWWNEDEGADLGRTAIGDINAVCASDCLVALLPLNGRTARGLWTEVGAAMAGGLPIALVGSAAAAAECFFSNHPLCQRFDSEDALLADIQHNKESDDLDA